MPRILHGPSFDRYRETPLHASLYLYAQHLASQLKAKEEIERHRVRYHESLLSCMRRLHSLLPPLRRLPTNTGLEDSPPPPPLPLSTCTPPTQNTRTYYYIQFVLDSRRSCSYTLSFLAIEGKRTFPCLYYTSRTLLHFRASFPAFAPSLVKHGSKQSRSRTATVSNTPACHRPVTSTFNSCKIASELHISRVLRTIYPHTPQKLMQIHDEPTSTSPHCQGRTLT
jgi:hypothetical protein